MIGWGLILLIIGGGAAYLVLFQRAVSIPLGEQAGFTVGLTILLIGLIRLLGSPPFPGSGG